MSKKTDLQEEAKDLEGFSKSLKVSELEALINANKDGEENAEQETDSETESTDNIEEETVESIEDGDPEVEEKEPEFKVFKSKKVVKAALIESIVRRGASARLVLEGKYNDVNVDSHYMHKYKPRAGNYFVTCDQGCKKYISSEELEADFVEVEE